MRGLEGNFQAQPRVFAHSAQSIVIGAVNNTHSSGGILITAPGKDYAVNDTITFSGGSTSLVITVTEVNPIPDPAAPSTPLNSIVAFTITNVGSGYAVNDNLTQSSTSGSGTGATAKVLNVDIPNTEERGCCLYVGVAADVAVVLEGNTTSTTFKGVPAGSFLPIQVTSLVSGQSAQGDILALF